MKFFAFEGENKRNINRCYKATFWLIAVFLFAFHGQQKASAQTSKQNKFQIFAPNTYELARYGDVPVNMSTGVPQIGVPLINFVEKDISLDISLSYHASGIKVDQEASWVGLGWALNAGGVITREIRGVPDRFNYAGNFNHRTSIPDYDGTISLSQYQSQITSTLYQSATDQTDNGADIFYFNFNGKVGKFFLDNDAQAVFAKYDDLKVEFLRNGYVDVFDYGYFLITDEKGIKYEFRAEEISRPISGGLSYVSAWYLSKITGPSGGEIIIEYTNGGMASNSQKRCLDQLYFPVNPYSPQQPLPATVYQPCFDRHTDIHGIVPKKIISSSGNYVELITSPNLRLDSDPGVYSINNQLDYIVLKDWNGIQIKKFKLSYDYFHANNNRRVPSGGNHPLNYRLRLHTVQEVSVNDELESPYTFEYYGDNDPLTPDSYTLPYRLSPSQDHWGYYNNSDNLTIFPENPIDKAFHIDSWYSTLSGTFTGGGPSFGYHVPTGSTREPDEEALKAGTLNKVVYPTGGYTKFNFEGHNTAGPGFPFYTMIGGARIKEVESISPGAPAVVKTYEYISDGGNQYDKWLQIDNAYYSYTWHNYDRDNPYNVHPVVNVFGDPALMMAYGVPGNLVLDNKFVGKVEVMPQVMLGGGMQAAYTIVAEKSVGAGKTIYHYNFDQDNSIFPGVSMPGMFHSSYVILQGSFLNQSITNNTFNPNTFPYPYFLNNDWRGGNLIMKEVFDENGTLLSLDSIGYDIQSLKAAIGYKTVNVDVSRYFYAKYYTVGGMVKPVIEVNKMYNPDGSFVRTVKEMEYNSTAHKQLTETRDYDSKGRQLTTKYYYPTEYGNTLSLLKEKHILLPVDIRAYKGSKLVSGEQTQYSIDGFPLINYKAETGGEGTDIPFDVQVPYTFEPKFTNVYNADHTLRSQTITDAVPTIFIWSYKGSHPVAQIQNATYEEVKTALNDVSETFINALRNKYEPSVSDLSILDGLRNSPVLKHAEITTYIFRPLVGMTMQTDPKGQRTSYEYDSFQRLKTIKDHNGDILKHYQYHYKPR